MFVWELLPSLVARRDREWFARADVHEQVRVIGHTEVGAAVAKTSVG
jgi:hypothetical protein